MNVERNRDGSLTVRGAGWFWARYRKVAGGILIEDEAEGMRSKPSHRAFLKRAASVASEQFEKNTTGR